MTSAFGFDPGDIPPEDMIKLVEYITSLGMEDQGVTELSPENMPPEIREITDRAFEIKAAKTLLFDKPHQHFTEMLVPSQRQSNVGPGDRCAYYMTSAAEHPILTILEVVDPHEYGEEFPDWQERFDLKGFVLGRYWTTIGHEHPELGWFSRIGLIPLDEQWMWDEYWGYLLEGNRPLDPPEWLLQLHLELVQGVASANAGESEGQIPVPTPAQCPSCGSKNVTLVTRETSEKRYLAGHKSDDTLPDHSVHGYAIYSFEASNRSWLECKACGHTINLTEDGYDVFIE